MKSSKSGNASVSFMQQMLRNNFLLLTVVLAVAVAAFIGVSLFRVLSY
jgi:hypothetical protein